MTIKKVAVIGAGTMGSGIAAHLANAGIEVELLDRLNDKGPDRDAIARGAIEKMAKTNPPPLMHARNAKKIRPGNMADHAARLKDCDLIIEAVFEDPKVKFDTFKIIDENKKPGAIIASNTSTIPLHDLVAGHSEEFRKDFLVTHFFNPPRYMRLLELVTSEYNDKAKVAEVEKFMDEKLGKGVIYCNDSPGFIANRIGTFWIQSGVNEAFDRKLTIEEADAVMGQPLGEKTGIFGLLDVVGLDLMPHISKSLKATLPADDAYVAGDREHKVINQMIADGYLGRTKGKGGGFYRRDKTKPEGQQDFSVDLETGALRPKNKQKMAAVSAFRKGGFHAMVETHDKGGDYAWAVLKKTLLYAAEHANGIAPEGIKAVDDAMKLGYGWNKGPFEIIDDMGVDYFIERVRKDGDKVPKTLEQAAGRSFYRADEGKLQYLNRDGAYEDVKRPEGVLLLSDIKRASKPVYATSQKPLEGIKSVFKALKIKMKMPEKVGAALWDIGDGVLCLEFTSDSNALDFWTMKTLNKAIDIIENKEFGGKYKALVIHNESPGKLFSAGANLGLADMASRAHQPWVIEKMVKAGQDAYKRLKYAKFPSVAAPSGMAFGGGAEIILHSSRVQAHAELYMGLVEVGVGLLPAWGGTTELLTRAFKLQQQGKIPGGPMPPVKAVADVIGNAAVSASAFDARDKLYLRAEDSITMNKDRLLFDAKKKALELVPNYTPEKPMDMRLPGPAGFAALRSAVDGFYLKGVSTPHDVVVLDKVGQVMTGGPKAGPGVLVSQDYVRALERKHFMELANNKKTINRIRMTLAGKKRPDVEKVEGKYAGPGSKSTAELRAAAEKADAHQGFIQKLKSVFCKACAKESANDNSLVRDPKPQVNWPQLKK